MRGFELSEESDAEGAVSDEDLSAEDGGGRAGDVWAHSVYSAGGESGAAKCAVIALKAAVTVSLLWCGATGKFVGCYDGKCG